MYQPGVYSRLSDGEIREAVKSLGFDPIVINDPPGRIYPPHTHPETKLLAILEGEMLVCVEDEKFRCITGDKIIIEGNVEHSARVGNHGCVFYWSEKLI